MEIWLELMGKHGIDKVLVNTHWLHGKVEFFLKNKGIGKAGGEKLWPEVHLFHEKSLLGSAGTLWANQEWFADVESFFILYGDNLTNVDLSKMYQYHLSHKEPFTLGVFRTTEPEKCGIVELDNDGVVIEFVEKPEKPKSNLAAAGVYIADKRIFGFLSKDRLENITGLFDLGFHVLPKLVGNMRAYEIEEFLMDIGTPETYKKAQELYRSF